MTSLKADIVEDIALGGFCLFFVCLSVLGKNLFVLNEDK